MSKRDDPAAKFAAKQQAWLTRTASVLQSSPEAVLPLLQMGRTQSIRLNPLRGDFATTKAELTKLGWLGAPYAWAANCYELAVPVQDIRDSDLVTSGKVFIQNAASWLPVVALDPQAGESILDVCAAPGGKTSHIAALTNNQAVLLANDNSRPRLAKMRANFARLGVSAEVCLFDAMQLARKLPDHQFDKILLDAPCSGEGLMQFNRAKDYESWSVAHIKRLSKLQKTILSQAWQLLKPGGTLVYSTCTMAPEEDEAVVDYLLRKNPEATIVPFSPKLPNAVPAVESWNDKPYSPEVRQCLRVQPSQSIEAFFVCKLVKSTTISEKTLAFKQQKRYDAA